MPNSNQHWTYDQFVEQADEAERPNAAAITALRRDIERATVQSGGTTRRAGSPFRSGTPETSNGIRWLMDAERATSLNVTFDDSTYVTRRVGYHTTEYADYLQNRKGVYQFIKDEPTRFDKAGAIRAYTAMRALRLPSAGISRAARMYGANELSRQACQTVKHFREDYRNALWTKPTGYKVVRWFENRKIEFHLPPLAQAVEVSMVTTRAAQWAGVVAQFRQAINKARAERRLARVDALAQKPPNIHLQKNALKLLRVYKKPDENVRSVGIEIECFIPRNADMTKLYPVAQFVNIGSDGSIHPDGDNMAGVELRVCTPAYKMAEVINQLCAILKDMKAKVNTSCGLHVHLDQRTRTPEEVQQTFTNFIRAQNLLFDVVPQSRRNNTYCKKHRGTDLRAAQRGGRYKAVNACSMGKHKTIEIRLFNGTVNASKIINWVKTLWAIEAGQPMLRCPKTFDIARRYWPLDPSTLQWLKARQEKFKTSTTTDNTDVMDVEPIEEN